MLDPRIQFKIASNFLGALNLDQTKKDVFATTGHPKLKEFDAMIEDYGDVRTCFQKIQEGKLSSEDHTKYCSAFIGMTQKSLMPKIKGFFASVIFEEFVAMFFGMKNVSRDRLSRLEAFVYEYYQRRESVLRSDIVNIYEAIRPDCGIFKLNFDDYKAFFENTRAKINDILDGLDSYFDSWGDGVSLAFATYNHKEMYQSFLDYFVKLDIILYGQDTSQKKLAHFYNMNFYREDLDLINPKIVPLSPQYVKANLNSVFLRMIRDLQYARVRLLSYELILSQLSDGREVLEYEHQLSAVLKMVVGKSYNYLDYTAQQRLEMLKPVIKIDKVEEHTTFHNGLSFCLRGLDPSTDHASVLKLFDDVQSILDMKGYSKEILKTISKIVITNKTLAMPDDLKHLDNTLGQYNRKVKTLVVYLDQVGTYKYSLDRNFTRNRTEYKVWEKLSKKEQVNYCDYSVYVLCHELGHHLHLNLFSDYVRATWEDIFWKKENDEMKPQQPPFCYVSAYALSNPEEDFAETFAYMATDAQLINDLPKHRFDSILKLSQKRNEFDIYKNNPASDNPRSVFYQTVTEILGDYVGASNRFDIEDIFAFVIPEIWNRDVYFENMPKDSQVAYYKATDYVRIDRRPLYYVAISHGFYSCKSLESQISEFLPMAINMLCLSFIEFYGFKALEKDLKTAGLVDILSLSSQHEIIEMLSSLVLDDIADGSSYELSMPSNICLFFRRLMQQVYDLFVHVRAFDFEPLSDVNEHFDLLAMGSGHTEMNVRQNPIIPTAKK